MWRVSRLMAGWQRVIALFFVFGLVTPLVLAPVVSAQAFDIQKAATVSPLESMQSKQIAAADVAGPKNTILPTKDRVENQAMQSTVIKQAPITPHEIVSKRTATSDVRQNKDGSFTQLPKVKVVL